MTFRTCPHGVWIVKCKICNGGPMCIHGDIKDICKTCDERKSNVYSKVCSVLKKTLPPLLSKLIPKNERWNITQEHIRNLSKGSRTVNSLP